MQITNLKTEEILEYAQKQFPNMYISLDETDFYLPSIESGEICVEGIDHPVYVSTHYAYEDHLVNGNQTRYKIPISIFYVKKDAYDVIYDNRGCCFVPYIEDGCMQHVSYQEFLYMIPTFVNIVKI